MYPQVVILVLDPPDERIAKIIEDALKKKGYQMDESGRQNGGLKFILRSE
jgi:hypothetical protein